MKGLLLDRGARCGLQNDGDFIRLSWPSKVMFVLGVLANVKGDSTIFPKGDLGPLLLVSWQSFSLSNSFRRVCVACNLGVTTPASAPWRPSATPKRLVVLPDFEASATVCLGFLGQRWLLHCSPLGTVFGQLS